MHDFLGVFSIAGAFCVPDGDVCAQRKRSENDDDQIDERPVGGYGPGGRLPAAPEVDGNQVDGCIKKLQDGSEGHRQGKDPDFKEEVPGGQVHFLD